MNGGEGGAAELRLDAEPYAGISGRTVERSDAGLTKCGYRTAEGSFAIERPFANQRDK